MAKTQMFFDESYCEPEGLRDPAFMVNRSLPVHRWVPWIAGFSGQFVGDVFRQFVPNSHRRQPVVLDPFAGVGTTLVQAVIHGFNALGFELNPYAALVTRCKLSALSVEERDLDHVIRELTSATAGPKAGSAHLKPTGFKSRIPFFSPQVEAKVLRILDLMARMPAGTLKDMVRIAFAAVMVSVSNYTYEPSLSTRPGAGKPLQDDADVVGAIAAKLREFQEDLAWLRSQPDQGCHKLYGEDFLTSHTKIRTSSVDLMLTSPPYMNNYHYVRNSRPQLFWLGLIEQVAELRELEEKNFGKFWQTVRDADQIDLLPEHAELTSAVEKIRRTRQDSKAYGGPGWANYVASYFNDCERFVGILKRVLRRGGVGIVVVGNSIIQGVPIETDRILGQLAENRGLKLEAILPLRAKRVGASITNSSVRRGNKTKAKLYENAVVLRNP